MSDDEQKHESYGMVGLSRCSIGPPGMNLFGSSIRHSSAMILTVRRASKQRSLNQEWYHGREEIVEIYLSPAQFAEFITTPNVGQGVPCTITHVGRERMEPCPEYNQRQLFHDEFKESSNEALDEAKAIQVEIDGLLAQERIGKKEREHLRRRLAIFVDNLRANLPFVHSQFNEAMDKTVTEAKAEVEEFVNAKIHSLGIEALDSEIARAIAAPAKSEPFLLKE